LVTIFLFFYLSFHCIQPPFYCPPFATTVPVSLLPINDEARNDAHIASTDVRLY